MDERDNKTMNKDAQGDDFIANVTISSTNSELGSYHWFHTLAARIRHISEYQMINGADGKANIKNQGKRVNDAIVELLGGYESIHNI